MEETFSYIKEVAHTEYEQIALENSKVRQNNDKFFLFDGIVYPRVTPSGVSVDNIHVSVSPLHYSLMERFSEVQDTLEDTNSVSIKNFFIDVLAISAQNLVLSTFLPSVLISKLKKDLEPFQYKILDAGDASIELDTVNHNVAVMNNHYASTIELLRSTLMERFLLQG